MDLTTAFLLSFLPSFFPPYSLKNVNPWKAWFSTQTGNRSGKFSRELLRTVQVGVSKCRMHQTLKESSVLKVREDILWAAVVGCSTAEASLQLAFRSQMTFLLQRTGRSHCWGTSCQGWSGIGAFNKQAHLKQCKAQFFGLQRTPLFVGIRNADASHLWLDRHKPTWTKVN